MTGCTYYNGGKCIQKDRIALYGNKCPYSDNEISYRKGCQFKRNIGGQICD